MENTVLVAVTQDNLHDFIAYCKAYRYEHDESDLYDSDLEAYDPQQWPAHMIVDEMSQEVLGAICIRKLPYLENKTKARIVLWHVAPKVESLENYSRLLKAVKPHLDKIDHLTGFFPEAKETVRGYLAQLGFEVDRYVWVLTRDDLPVEGATLPEGYSVRVYEGPQDAKDWCEVRNAAFKTVKGSETPTPESFIQGMFEESLPGGMLILSHGNRPVGVIRVLEEIEDDKHYTFVAPVAVHPDYHGIGLGRYLLRKALQIGKEQGCPYGMLSVNALNEKATALYIGEGFKKDMVVMCYILKL